MTHTPIMVDLMNRRTECPARDWRVCATDEGLEAMRGLWDHEQPLAPSLLRSALALAGGFLAALALGVVLQGVVSVVQGQYLAALVQVAGGIAFPFAIWLGLKMLADILTVLNRSYDRLDALEERFGGYAQQPGPRLPPAGPRALRAGDDGPAYPSED
jgi:hypothetical protein